MEMFNVLFIIFSSVAFAQIRGKAKAKKSGMFLCLP